MIGKRVLGVFFILIAVTGLIISIGGVIVSRQAIMEIGSSYENTLDLTADSLDNIHETLLLTKTTVNQVSSGLDTVGETAVNVSTTISSTKPLMDQVTQVAAKDVPKSLESIQQAIPDVAEAAGAIDDTLRLLDSFDFEREIFGIPIRFDLGINYKPENALDDTVLDLGTSLDGVPESLRSLDANLGVASENLSVVGQNLEVIAGELDQLNNTLKEIEPLIDEYLRLTTETSDLIRLMNSQLDRQLQTIQLAVTALFIWIGLNQLVPIYLAWTLLTHQDRKAIDEPTFERVGNQDIDKMEDSLAIGEVAPENQPDDGIQGENG